MPLIPKGVVQLPDLAGLDFQLKQHKLAKDAEAKALRDKEIDRRETTIDKYGLTKMSADAGVILAGFKPEVNKAFKEVLIAGENYKYSGSGSDKSKFEQLYSDYAQKLGAAKFKTDEYVKENTTYGKSRGEFAVSGNDYMVAAGNYANTVRTADELLNMDDTFILPRMSAYDISDPIKYGQDKAVVVAGRADDFYDKITGKLNVEKATEFYNSSVRAALADTRSVQNAVIYGGLSNGDLGGLEKKLTNADIERASMIMSQDPELASAWSNKWKADGLKAFLTNLERNKGVAKEGDGKPGPYYNLQAYPMDIIETLDGKESEKIGRVDFYALQEKHWIKGTKYDISSFGTDANGDVWIKTSAPNPLYGRGSKTAEKTLTRNIKATRADLALLAAALGPDYNKYFPF